MFAGPFAKGKNAMAATYPPQRDLRVVDTYPGPHGKVAWRIMGDDAYNDNGEIVGRRLIKSPGITFLHSVIEIEEEMTLPVIMSSTSPAELFVNGQPVLQCGDDGASPSYARVDLTRGTNAFLVKVACDLSTRISFNLGDENNPGAYDFNNNLAEILDGYATLLRRQQGGDDEPLEAQKVITLRYENATARTVSVIGTFNGWSPDRSPMRAVSVGTWEIVLTLPPGKHSYRFLVDNREQILDPSNESVESDGFGGQNSVIVIK